MLNESGFCILNYAFFWNYALFCKNKLVVIYAKILYYSFVPTIHENFKSIFLLIVQTKKILLDRRYDDPSSIYSRFAGMTI